MLGTSNLAKLYAWSWNSLFVCFRKWKAQPDGSERFGLSQNNTLYTLILFGRNCCCAGVGGSWLPLVMCFKETFNTVKYRNVLMLLVLDVTWLVYGHIYWVNIIMVCTRLVQVLSPVEFLECTWNSKNVHISVFVFMYG